MQYKDGKGIADKAVTILDPRGPEAVKPCLGLRGDFTKLDDAKNFYHNVNCFIEAKREHNVATSSTSWISILGQLKKYHLG